MHLVEECNDNDKSVIVVPGKGSIQFTIASEPKKTNKLAAKWQRRIQRRKAKRLIAEEATVWQHDQSHSEVVNLQCENEANTHQVSAEVEEVRNISQQQLKPQAESGENSTGIYDSRNDLRSSPR